MTRGVLKRPIRLRQGLFLSHLWRSVNQDLEGGARHLSVDMKFCSRLGLLMKYVFFLLSWCVYAPYLSELGRALVGVREGGPFKIEFRRARGLWAALGHRCSWDMSVSGVLTMKVGGGGETVNCLENLAVCLLVAGTHECSWGGTEYTYSLRVHLALCIVCGYIL